LLNHLISLFKTALLTNLVLFQSEESTGGSTTGDDEESSDAAHVAASVAGGGTLSAETRKNTMQVN
jgi:hypothetical protein